MASTFEETKFLENKAQQVVRLALALNQKKLPLKREDIIKYVLKEHSRKWKPVLVLAKKILEEGFGLELYEIGTKLDKDEEITKKSKGEGSTAHPTQTATTKSAQAIYLLKNNLNFNPYAVKGLIVTDADTINNHLNHTNQPLLGQTQLILTLIFINRHQLAHDKLVNLIKDFEPTLTEVEIENWINKLLKQHYLIKEKQTSISDNLETNNELTSSQLNRELKPKSNYLYRWGTRAKLEINYETMVTFFKAIYGDEAPFNLKGKIEMIYKTMN